MELVTLQHLRHPRQRAHRKGRHHTLHTSPKVRGCMARPPRKHHLSAVSMVSLSLLLRQRPPGQSHLPCHMAQHLPPWSQQHLQNPFLTPPTRASLLTLASRAQDGWMGITPTQRRNVRCGTGACQEDTCTPSCVQSRRSSTRPQERVTGGTMWTVRLRCHCMEIMLSFIKFKLGVWRSICIQQLIFCDNRELSEECKWWWVVYQFGYAQHLGF